MACKTYHLGEQEIPMSHKHCPVERRGSTEYAVSSTHSVLCEKEGSAEEQ